MSHDNDMRGSDAPWRRVGIGMAISSRCGRCGQPMPNLGRRLQNVNGAKLYVGKCCQKKAAA